MNRLKDELADKQLMIETLQLQVMTYREDFQSERQDRERAQSHINDLQDQINTLTYGQHSDRQQQVRLCSQRQKCNELE